METSNEAKQSLNKNPLKLKPRATQIYKFWSKFSTLQKKCIAYAAAEHLDRGYCDDPDVYLCGKGGILE